MLSLVEIGYVFAWGITNTWWMGTSQNLGILNVVVYIVTTGIQRIKLLI
jgi:hypothetical protein